MLFCMNARMNMHASCYVMAIEQLRLVHALALAWYMQKALKLQHPIIEMALSHACMWLIHQVNILR